ncbi:MAG: LysR family transcriptional regulator [Hyphomicrobiales bacterium]|nr:LysR family transcriptional regulator [Hyphomicrobiales bacterium]MCP5000077.1 LysR family transcriptional regulator [Hyphomicrobiales bacterium]
MRYSQLKAFHSVAQYGGFSRAAEAIFQTQPALSEQVRRLEQEYDVLLFHRERKRVRLTEEGKNLFLLTKRFFEAEQQIEEYMSETRSAVDGTLRIIVDSAHHVTDTLSRFRARHPDVFVSLRTGNTDDILNELRAYNAEIGVVGSMDPGSEFETVDLGSTPIIAFAAKGYLASELEQISLHELAGMQLVFREKGSKTRQKLEEEAARQKVSLKPAFEVEGREAMREVVASGSGVGFVSEAEFGNDSRLVKVRIKDADLRMTETLVFMSPRRDVRIIRTFMGFVSATA